MVDILPFRGLRYNLEKLEKDKLSKEGASLNDVVTPPYDVIDEAQQQAFYDRHPANFIRLDLGLKTPKDHETDNPYTRARDYIAQWETEQTLIPEAVPAFYAYSQTWAEDGQTIERKGMLALLRLEEFDTQKVLPHEYTLKGPKQDRLQLMQTTLCSLSQVFMIYSDPDRLMEGLLYEQAAAHHGWAQATDAAGVAHRFKPVTDPGVVERLQAMFKDKTLLIADGHHRYETALGFARDVRDELKRQTGTEPAPGALLSDYGMIFLTNMDDPGLKVYPTHRVLYQWPEGWNVERFETELFKRYEPTATQPTFIYQKPGEKPVSLRLKADTAVDLPPLLDTFDAALLEETVFKGIFNQNGEALKSQHLLGFYRDDDAVSNRLEQREAVCAFWLAAPSVKLVHQICESGHRMPQKSTYFYPKILSGLVIYPYRPFAGKTEHALSGIRNAQALPADFKFPQMAFSQRPY